MLDGSQMEEMTGAVGLGLFAGDAVLALGRTIEGGGAVSEDDRPILTRGLKLLESLREPADAWPTSAGPSQLGIGGTGLDVLTAIEAEAADTDVDTFLIPLATALKQSLDGEGEGDIEQLKTLRRVFIAIGDAEVERVSGLSQPRSPSIPLWKTTQATFRS